MTNEQINARMSVLVKADNNTTFEILELINLAYDQKAYCTPKSSSLHRWLTNCFKVSDSSAALRIASAKLLRHVPDLKRMIIEGETNITVAATIQRVIDAEQSRAKAPVPTQTQRAIVAKIPGLTTAQAEHVALATFPQVQRPKKKPKITNLSATECSLTITFPAELRAKLEFTLNHMSNKIENVDLNKAFIKLIEDYYKKHNPTERAKRTKSPKPDNAHPQTNSTTLKHRNDAPIPHAIKVQVLADADSTCERCGSQYNPQVDHITPRALGGPNTRENLRVLCGPCNRQSAAEKLGEHRWLRRGPREHSVF